jgi:hypothetical protein
MRGDPWVEVDALLLSLLADDRGAGLEVRRLDVRDQAPVQARGEALLHASHVGGDPVGGDDDLFACLVEGVEDVKKLIHGAVAARDELDVVDKEDVAVLAVAAAELIKGVGADGADELVHEALGALEGDPEVWALAEDVVAEGVEEVGLAEADAAVDEEGVEAATWLLRGRPGG